MNRINEIILVMVFSSLLAACGGDDSNNGGSTNTAPDTATTPNLSFQPVKVFHFSWSDASNTTHYKLLENPNGASGFTQVGEDIPQGTGQYEHVVPLYQRLNAQYILQSCNDFGCTDAAPVMVSGTLEGSIGYFKASNTDASDGFGASVALSADGNTLAISAHNEDSAATSVNGNEANNSTSNTGAVYLFTRSGSTWNQQAYLKASNTDGGDQFGYSLDLSTDGNTLAVGARNEDSAATGINGNEANNSSNAGAVYLFTRSGSTWNQQAYLKASNTDADDWFGDSIALSANGDTLAVGAVLEGSTATGINGNETDNSATYAGAVYLFTRNGTAWSQQAYIKASNTADDGFGDSVTLSADGDTLAVSANYEASAATGINGDETDNSAPRSGAVYLFTRSGTVWSQQAYLKASNTGTSDWFGRSTTLSADGNTLAVGATGEASAATGINGDEANNSVDNAGAVYLFTRSGSTWSQQAYLKASNTGAYDGFGHSVALSTEGNTLAVGAYSENSATTGINGNEADNSTNNAGAVYLFTRSGSTWSQQAYLKASNTDADDLFGRSIALSADSDTLVVGAFGEGSADMGIGANQNDNSATSAGAVYVY